MGRVSKSLPGIILLTLFSCGKPAPEPAPPPPPPLEVALPVIGVAGFGSQCPYGFTEDPFPVRLEAWGCPVGLDQLELSDPLTPLYLQVDCKKKVVNVRKQNRGLDTAWEIYPDGTFFITINGGVANLKSDGPGRTSCSTPMSVNLGGKVDCADRDRATINLESVFWLGKTDPVPSPSGSPSPTPSALPTPLLNTGTGTGSCKLPTGCYMYAKTLIKQCQ